MIADAWLHAELLTIREAACVLTGIDPSSYRYNNRALPHEADGMETLIERAVLLKRVRAFSISFHEPQLGETFQISPDEVSPGMILSADQTTIETRCLAEWCDSKGIFHPFPTLVATAEAGAKLLSIYPNELRAAIEAFNAVRSDPALTTKQTPRAALAVWLQKNKPELSAGARERIATVANWQPQGGAPKTLG